MDRLKPCWQEERTKAKATGWAKNKADHGGFGMIQLKTTTHAAFIDRVLYGWALRHLLNASEMWLVIRNEHKPKPYVPQAAVWIIDTHGNAIAMIMGIYCDGYSPVRLDQLGHRKLS